MGSEHLTLCRHKPAQQRSVQRSSDLRRCTLLSTCSRSWLPQHLSSPQIPGAQDAPSTMRALLQASLNISPPSHGTGAAPAGQPGITANGHNSAIYALVGVMLVVVLITAIFASMACLKSRQASPAEAQKVGRRSALWVFERLPIQLPACLPSSAPWRA